MDKLRNDILRLHTNLLPKILMVDDREANLIALEKVMKNEQAQLIRAYNGNEALQLMLEHEFALALLDVQMPGMDGYELAEIMRSDSSTADIPIIFVSAIFTNKLNIFKGYEMGAFSFITKPFEPIELLNKVQFFLDKYLTEKAYDNSRVKYMDLYNSSPDMLVSIDVETALIMECNQTLLNNTGFTKSEILEKTVYELYTEKSVDKIKVAFEEFKITGKLMNAELSIKTKRGGEIDVLLKAEAIKDLEGNIISCNSSLSDISELNKTRNELEKTMLDLESYNQELKSFVYLTSHDLQEPIVTVQSFLEVLKEEYQEVLKGAGIEYIDFCVEATGRMRQMVTALLEYLRMGQDHKVSKINFTVLIKKIMTSMDVSIKNMEAKISTGEMPELTLNDEEMELLFQNLISNALKFKRENIKPQITINAVEVDAFWEFTIADNGIGIEERQYEKLFQMFRQIHQRGVYEGLGVGLAICKKIVEKNGGRIWIESKVGEGSKFIFTLPKVTN